MMTIPKAILCLDIDGTLIDDHEQVHPEDIEILKDFPNSIQLILTTGRPLGSAKGVLHANNLYNDSLLPLPGVFMNGTTAYLPDEKLAFEHHFSGNVLQQLINLAESHQETTFAFFTRSNVHLVNPNEFSVYVAKKHYLSFRESKSSDIPMFINKMMVMDRDRDKLEKIKSLTHEIMAEIAYSLPYLLEFTPLGIDKPTGLKSLLSVLTLKWDSIYAAGDGQNDLGLFELAEMSFAPSTAHQSIQQKADRIIHRRQKGILYPIIESISNK